MTTMLLADHGAQVTKIEPPGGDPFRRQPGYRVWQRGKRSAILRSEGRGADRELLLTLAAHADVLVESFAPGVTARLGIDYATLPGANPRLIYCSITGYGRDNRHADRPGYDALVAARSGLHWEQRGWPGGRDQPHVGGDDRYRGRRHPDGVAAGRAARRPALSGLRPGRASVPSSRPRPRSAPRCAPARSPVAASGSRPPCCRAAFACASGVWQRAEKIDVPMFNSWILGSRSPKGHFECADGRWIHNWVPNPRFLLTAAAGETLNATLRDRAHKNDPDRVRHRARGAAGDDALPAAAWPRR